MFHSHASEVTVYEFADLEVLWAYCSFEIYLLILLVDLHEQLIAIRQTAVNQLCLQIQLNSKIVLQLLKFVLLW